MKGYDQQKSDSQGQKVNDLQKLLPDKTANKTI